VTSHLTEYATSYLKELGMPGTLVARALEMVRYWEGLTPEPLDRIFVTEYVTDEGVREFENLWLISNTWIVECHSFVNVDRGDLMRLEGGLARIEIDKHEFTPGAATPASRLKVEANFAGGTFVASSFKASGTNCEALHALVVELLIPQVRSC
jgi:hypothetical protein